MSTVTTPSEAVKGGPRTPSHAACAVSRAQVMVKLLAEYEREPYPSEQELARIAKDLAAPGPTQVLRNTRGGCLKRPHHSWKATRVRTRSFSSAEIATHSQVRTFFENMRLKSMSGSQ